LDWQRELMRARIEAVEDGISGASVYRIAPERGGMHYLKIAQHSAPALRREIARTQWLAQRGVRVPAILRVDDSADHVAVEMQALPGRPADATAVPAPQLAEALARGLAALHALPRAGCLFDESIAVRLARAAAAIDSGEIRPEGFADRHCGVEPNALLARLTAEQPTEDFVVVHGDATLSNIIVDADGTIGFVDCGNAGCGDRYIDLAVLADDIANHYGAEAAAHFTAIYGDGGWNTAKARYFVDLYELF
jgi:aminoglycoside phosphotransferase